MKLPNSLAPWAPSSPCFPRTSRFHLADSCGALPWRSAHRHGPVPVSRGTRTATTASPVEAPTTDCSCREWVIADEIPDEFIRRVAEGEHTFHELARSQPAKDRTSTVLFDTGPDQLGAPRLAHLAG